MGGERRDLGEKDTCSDVLVVPAEGVIGLICAEGLPVGLNVTQIGGVPCRLVKPSCSP